MANSRVFFSDLKSGNCSSVVKARLLRFWVDMLRVSRSVLIQMISRGTNLAENRVWLQGKSSSGSRTEERLCAQHERPDNNALKAENDKSRCENIAIKEALKHAIFKAHKQARTQITQEKGRSVKQIRAVNILLELILFLSSDYALRWRGGMKRLYSLEASLTFPSPQWLKRFFKPRAQEKMLKTVGSRSIAARGKKGSEITHPPLNYMLFDLGKLKSQ
ncbi:unnamed protein product [Brassica oleracea]